ncbi:hypothetical protein SPFL3102_01498 [Sporomusaceae bacterium FL31]|nr:hypothetical protein SPFL3101_03131 [Sporomusaceae bacterium FL31]GCE33690.1 hypothetical protein SPFL3102_01498 [Sporomusaceae bacterium]
MMENEKNINPEHEQIIRMAAEVGANTAMKYIEQNRKKQVKSRQDRRLRNTKLLLKNYNLLKNHINKSIFSIKQVAKSENAIDVLDTLDDCDSNTYINSIKRSVARTYIIIAHIDEMLELYKYYCLQSGNIEDERRLRILHAYFFYKRKIEEILEEEKIDERTFYRDIRKVCSKLSSLIFGIDGLDDVAKNCQ